MTDGDIISRKQALAAFGLSEQTRKYGGDHSGYDTMMLYEIQDILENLPDVSDIEVGEWLNIYAESEGSRSYIEFDCPHCGCGFGIESGEYGWAYGDAIPWKACPMCGGKAEHKMEGEP